MQYLWAVTFVARPGSLRWPLGPRTSRSPGNIRRHYSPSWTKTQPRDIPIPVIGQNLKHSSYTNLSEWFRVIYVVACPCSCLFQLVHCNFLFLVSGQTAASEACPFFFIRLPFLLKRPEERTRLNHTVKRWLRDGGRCFTGAYAPSMMASSLPQRAHVQWSAIVTGSLRLPHWEKVSYK